MLAFCRNEERGDENEEDDAQDKYPAIDFRYEGRRKFFHQVHCGNQERSRCRWMEVGDCGKLHMRDGTSDRCVKQYRKDG